MNDVQMATILFLLHLCTSVCLALRRLCVKGNLIFSSSLGVLFLWIVGGFRYDIPVEDHVRIYRFQNVCFFS